MNSDTETLLQMTEELTAMVLEPHSNVEQRSLFIDQLLKQICLVQHQHFGTCGEQYYNRERRHGYIGDISPAQFE